MGVGAGEIYLHLFALAFGLHGLDLGFDAFSVTGHVLAWAVSGCLWASEERGWVRGRGLIMSGRGRIVVVDVDGWSYISLSINSSLPSTAMTASLRSCFRRTGPMSL